MHHDDYRLLGNRFLGTRLFDRLTAMQRRLLVRRVQRQVVEHEIRAHHALLGDDLRRYEAAAGRCARILDRMATLTA